MTTNPAEKNIAGHVEAVTRVETTEEVQAGGDKLDHERAHELGVTFDPNSPENKALVRKLDWRLVPCTWTLYLLSNVDRANIGSVPSK